MSRIVSSLPGRIRVRDKLLRNRERVTFLERELRCIEGVTSVQANPDAGSIVVNFDAVRRDATLLEEEVDAVIDGAVAVPISKGAKRQFRTRANRYAKAGMLGSLATSLALAASGQKRWHAVTGGIFVACLGVHLGIHRRSLLR